MSYLIKYKYYILTILVIFLVFLFLFLFINSKKKVNEDIFKIELIGNDETINLYQDFHDEGVTFTLNDEVIDSSLYDLSISNNINKYVIGSYTINYSILYNDKSYNISRNVKVVDNENPVLISSDVVYRYNCATGTCSSLQYYALDDYDGVLTDKVNIKYNDGIVDLEVSDSSNNVSSLKIPYYDIDKIDNYIELNGTSLQYVRLGDTYKEYGAVVKDSNNKNTNYKVDISSDVDTNKEGTYKVLYSYSIGDITIQNVRLVIVYKEYKLDKVKSDDKKIIYLTFDDGPGKYTEDILDILDKYDVKATFFVTNQFSKYQELIGREYEDGHTVGCHSYSHKWTNYNSVQNYILDFQMINEIQKKYTGEDAKYFRFTGGSSNTVSKGHALGVVRAIASSMSERGYRYFDWNVDSNDAGGATSDQIVKNVIKGISSNNISIVLMHDIKSTTKDALEEIIKYGLDNGYTFKSIDDMTITSHHGINN